MRRLAFLCVVAGLLVKSVIGAETASLIEGNRTLPDGTRLGEDCAIALVLVPEQRLIVHLGGGSNLSYRVSTALAGVGAKAGSDQTPPGWHKVASRFGLRAPIGQVFRSRRPVDGLVLPEEDWRSEIDDDAVTSRILWLQGLEKGVNQAANGSVDSYLRHIYIHGTNQEQFLGRPASHGCIRMGNRDIVALVELLRPFESVYVKIIPSQVEF